MQTIILFLAGCFAVLLSFGQKVDSVKTKYAAQETRITYSWENKTTDITVLSYGDRKDIVMINLHDDETTSVEAAKQVLEETGGVLIKIENESKRLINFAQHGRIFSFDPNRMFTREGIRASLLRHTKYSSEPAIKKIEGFARLILDQIPQNVTTLIALHNNDEGRLSVSSYEKGGEYKNEAAIVAKAPGQDPDNFFFTTDSRLFKQLKRSGYNVVLQENKKATNDGSLSIYYGRRKKSYVNVEAEIGKLEEQKKMIQSVAGFIVTGNN